VILALEPFGSLKAEFFIPVFFQKEELGRKISILSLHFAASAKADISSSSNAFYF